MEEPESEQEPEKVAEVEEEEEEETDTEESWANINSMVITPVASLLVLGLLLN